MCLIDDMLWSPTPRARARDHELEFGRLYHRQISGILAFEDAANIDAGLPIKSATLAP